MDLTGFAIDGVFLETSRTRVFRGRDEAGVPVIVKMPAAPNPSAREIARYQRAFDLGREADHRAVVQHLALQRHLATVALVTEDWGADPLSTLVVPGGLPLPHWLELAENLATALARLHASGIVHKDVNPSNILVDHAGRDVRFIDLGAATALRTEVGDTRALHEVEGTLAYMPPEQCGRIASMVDDRADLYSLGVTLFELACGRRPFVDVDPQALAHAHVARLAPRIDALRVGFPTVVADIVAALLNKDAGDRYATAVGLAHDLATARQALARTGNVGPFPLKQADHTATFRIPDRLFGRESHRERLLAAVAETGGGVFVQIQGASGIGKTALVHQLRRGIAAAGGTFCAGKFDQFRSDMPYLGVLQALRSLVRGVLTEPDAVLERRRHELEGALGTFGRLLTDVIPELEAIVGPQPPVDEVNHLDATRRFHRVVARFLGVFATREHRLVLFVDDVQWADPPTLHLLESLRENPDAEHVVLITGHRSNEVGPGHPVRACLERLANASYAHVVLELGPLNPDAVNAMLAETLHVEPSITQTLANRIHTIAGGNPFFVRELLFGLRDRGFFRYDEAEGAWVWKVADLHTTELPANLTDLLTARLAGLPAETLHVLDTASCVGSEFDLDTLANVHGVERPTIAERLAAAVATSLIVPLDSDYRVFEALAAWGDTSNLEGLRGVRYRFQHDRVRQTVHERLDDTRRSERHVQIGRLLLRNLAPDELERRQVEVFTHLLFGLPSIQDTEERARLALLGLSAGRSALRSLAFGTAHRLLEGTAGLLPPDPWSVCYDLTLGTHTSLAECAHARSDYARFEQEAQQVIQHARSPLDAARVHGLRIRVEGTQTRYAEAVTIGVEVAATLGVRLPRRPGLPSVLIGVAQTLWAQGNTDAMAFAALPEATDREITEAISVLGQSASAAYFAEPNLLPLIGITATRLSLKHGVTPTSPYGFAVWALVLCGVLGRIENGGRFGELALAVGRRYGGVDEARARFVVDTFVRHWREPLEDCARQLFESWSMNRDAGDEESATYSAGVMLYTHFFAGGPLDAHEQYAQPIGFLRDCNVPHVKHCFLAWAQLYEALAQPELPDELVGRWYDHRAMLPGFIETNNAVQIAISSTAAGLLDLLAGRLPRANERFDLALKYEENVVGQVIVPALAFLSALARYRLAIRDGRSELLRGARKSLGRLRKWAVHAPFNLDHRVALLEAYDALVRGRMGDAVLGFNRALDGAGDGAFFYNALAQQGLAEALERAGQQGRAAEATQLAMQQFQAWGAPALCQGLVDLTSKASTSTSSSTSSGVSLHQLDLRSLLASVAMLSSEADEDTLLARLMETVCESSGADRGLLLLADPEGAVVVEAEWLAGKPLTRPEVLLDRVDVLARGAFDLARRTNETVVIVDASTDRLVERDPHIAAHGARSLLVAPMVLQRRTLGWLYLENHVARGAFNPNRVALIEALGAQAAITLDNARLYRGMQQALVAQVELTEANRRFVPEGFLSGLRCESIVDVKLNEAVEREISVLFVDLRGFSAIAMQLGPTGTVRMINRYLSYVQPSITGEGGFVGQYYGDGVLALFPDEADSSIRAAVSMCRGLEAYNRDRGDLPELTFGMGLHSGAVTLGTIGDPHHFQCSVVGDSVNLASRMEGLTKHYGATLVLSGSTHERLVNPAGLAIRALGRVQVVGRTEVLDVYDCLDCYGPVQRDRILAHAPVFDAGVQAYTAGDWITAERQFRSFTELCPDDRVGRSFQLRCADRIQDPPDWDGVERPGKGKD